MTESDVEQRLIDAFSAARQSAGSNPDLFARVQRSVQEDQERRRWRWHVTGWCAGFLGGLGAVAATLGDFNEGSFTMQWWLIELLTDIVLVAIAILLGPFIKRFGRAYAADVFHANPRTGKSYLILTDVAYYLIFSAFILFTVSFKDNWAGDRADQFKVEVARVGGILLIMGILHAANVVALPVIGQMLSANSRNLTPAWKPSPAAAPTSSPGNAPQLGPGTWILRIESAEQSPAIPTPPAET